MKNYEITSQDLNLIDGINGKATLDYKEYVPLELKGAFAEFNGNYSNGEFNSWLQNRLLYIQLKKEEIINLICEMWDYKNLPENFDKYNLETFLCENGSVAFFKNGTDLIFTPYSIEERDIFNNPIKIKTLTPNDKVNNKILTSGKFEILKNNRNDASVFILTIRYLNGMEKTIYELEKNITASAPKGIIINNGQVITSGENTNKSDSMNSIVNGQDTFYEMNISDISQSGSILADDRNQLFVPIELRDRTDELIKNYSFYKEMLKEEFGFGVNILNGKKERLITDETENQQELSDMNRVHMFEIRKLGIEKINKKFGTNIIIEDKESKRAKDLEDKQNGELDKPGDSKQKKSKLYK